MTADQVTKVLQLIPILAPEIQSAILAIFRAPAMSKEELLAQAEDLDDQTLLFLERELAKAENR